MGFHLPRRARRVWTQLIAGAVLFAPVAVGLAEPPDDVARLKERMVRFRDQSKWPEAMPLAEKVFVETAKRHGEDNVNTVDALHDWAWLVQQNGDYDQAERLWLRALAIDEKLFGKGTVQTTRRLHLLANLYRDRGDYRKSAPLLQKALAIREGHFGREHPETAQVLRSLGRIYLDTGDFERAEAVFLRALDIYQKGGPNSRRNVAAILAVLGWLYVTLGDDDRAEEMISGALDLRTQIYGMEHETTAHSLHELALIHRRRGRFERAEEMLWKSLEIRQRLLGTNHVSLAGILDDIGRSYLVKDEFEKAETVLRRAQALLEQNLGPEHPEVAEILLSLSRLNESRGDYAQAREMCQSAYELRKKSFGPSHRLTIRSLRQLACLDMALAEPERALAVADDIQNGEEALLGNVLSFTSERQRLVAQHASSAFLHRYDLWANLGAVVPLERAILRTKGLVLDSLLEDRLLADASDDPRVRELIAEGTEVRRRLAGLPPLVPRGTNPTHLIAELNHLSEKVEALEASLARRVAGVGHTRRALSVSADQVRSALTEGTVLLEVLRYRRYIGKARWQENYGMLILSRDENPRWVCLGPADTIEKSIRLYQHAVRGPDASGALVQVLRDLHDTVWSPVIPKLPARTKRIIVSPDGELNFVSFASLLTPANHFLGEEFLFSYVACARDLLAENKAAPAGPGFLVWANPDFDLFPGGTEPRSGGPRGGEFRGLSFPSLPGAEKEANMLRVRAGQLGFREAVFNLGAKATEAELYRLRSPKVLHLATHAFFLAPIKSFDPTEARYSEVEDRNSVVPTFNPMRRSGLALAGAQQTLQRWSEGDVPPGQNDGIVTADEIAGLDLRGTWLVVLSACNTGTGEAQAGEGVLGLRRGFVQAGAQNLLLTLWPIDDQNSVALLADFYAQLGKSRSPAQALARAQSYWLKRLRIQKGAAEACRLAGPFILSFQGRPD